ncbi:MAG: 4-hydroxythreonine-4-phosphate dehydrogenase [Paenibacillus sp.]|jgi:4-hydroxythreonine-4-phosphate dehydrogenase|nr:4-hydroxythreonine-4-phosphate dehydrogenase [Paenibacillus sp.]
MENQTKPVMALAYGDAAGIGPELVAKALQTDEIRSLANWVLIGDERVFKQGAEIAGVTLDYRKIDSIEQAANQADEITLIDLQNLNPDEIQPGTLSPKSGLVSGQTLETILQLVKGNHLDGVVYAPLNKEAMFKGGLHFEDDIHFLADLLGVKEGFSEVNVMENLWVTRVTSHIALKDVAARVTKERVGTIIRFAHDTLTAAGFHKPRIMVAALNPHGGEGGLFGTEEINGIVPAVKEAQAQGIDAVGPYPADTIFLRLKSNPFDCLVAMYHDQAQTGMKLMGFNKGVTVSGGLPVVLATPAHGTAFDIAGKGVADPGAIIHAMKLAVRLVEGKRGASRAE